MSQLKDFQVLCRLGEGSFSTVYKVRRVSDKKEYALKKVKITTLKPKERENAVNEVRILASIDNPFIIQYKEAFIDNQFLCLIMEIAPEGDLLEKIKKKQATRTFFAEKEIWLALYHCCLGLRTMHKMKILHRDIKCANIFLVKDETGQTIHKLGDLNVSKVAKQGLVHTQTGTPYYASPEVWKDKPYNSKSDIWSLGCIIYEMAAQKPPFRAQDMNGLYKKVVSGVYDPLPKMYSQDLNYIIGKLLQTDPKNRPSCDDILNDRILLQRLEDQSDFDDISNITTGDLLDTIKMPNNIGNLQGKLPKAQYHKVKILKQVSESRQSRINSVQDQQNQLPRLMLEHQNRENQKIQQTLQPSSEVNRRYGEQQSLSSEKNLLRPYEFLKHKQMQEEIDKKQQQLLRNYQYLEQQQQQNEQIQNNYKHLMQRDQEKEQSYLQKPRPQHYSVDPYQEILKKPHRYPLDIVSMSSNQSQVQGLMNKQQRYKQQHDVLQKQLQKLQDNSNNLAKMDDIQRQQMYIRDKISQYMNEGAAQEQDALSKHIKQLNQYNKNYQNHQINEQDNHSVVSIQKQQNKIQLAAGQQILSNQVSKPSWWG